MRANMRSRAPFCVIFIQLVGFFLLAGCAGDGEGLDQNGRPSTPGSAGTALTADFNSIQDNVFTPVCTRCHAGATAPRGLRLDAGSSYALLVGVASGEVPSVQRVQAGNPNASYLIQKLEGSAAVGARMPLGGPFLPQATIDVIRQWIANGAPRPVTVAVAQKTSLASDAIDSGLHVVTTAPLNDSVAEEPLGQIVLGFDRELDANRVNASTVSLINLDSNTAVATRLSVPIVNPSNLLVTPNAPLTQGAYRLVLRGSGGGPLAGLDARSLDASPGTAPGTEGTDYTLTFAIGPATAANEKVLP